MSSMKESSYQLNLDPPKRNVFVTQIIDRDYNDDDDIRKFAVVQESADHLLHTGINTLQKTSLLRKAVEIESVERELNDKREEFAERMRVNQERAQRLKRGQEELRLKMIKFDKFLKDNNAKRSRALHKYQKEVKENAARSRELEQLMCELEAKRAEKEAVIKKLQDHKIFERYLMGVVDILPDDYVEMTAENVIFSVIQRFEGLSHTRDALISRKDDMGERLEEGARHLEAMKGERARSLMLINGEMADMQARHESLVQRIQTLEQESADLSAGSRRTVGELGAITMAIDNLTHLCREKHWPAHGMTYVQKLHMISQHFRERQQVWHALQQQMRALRNTALPPLPPADEARAKSGAKPGGMEKLTLLPGINR